MALRFKIRHYLPGHFIIKQGDEVKRLYFIAKGNIDVVKYDDTMLTLGECSRFEHRNLIKEEGKKFVQEAARKFSLTLPSRFDHVPHSRVTPDLQACA